MVCHANKHMELNDDLILIDVCVCARARVPRVLILYMYLCPQNNCLKIFLISVWEINPKAPFREGISSYVHLL